MRSGMSYGSRYSQLTHALQSMYKYGAALVGGTLAAQHERAVVGVVQEMEPRTDAIE